MTFLDTRDIDILICDLNMPRQSGLELTIMLRQRHPDVKVLLLTMMEEAATIREAVRAGVSGYVLKRVGHVKIEQAISQLMSGRWYFSSGLMEQLATLNNDVANPVDELAILTDREIQVLTLVSQ